MLKTILLLADSIQVADHTSCNDLMNLLRSKLRQLDADANSQLIQVCISVMRDLRRHFPSAQEEVKTLVQTMFADMRGKFEESSSKEKSHVAMMANIFAKYSLLINQVELAQLADA